MQEIKFIQVTPDQLTELIRDGVRKELRMFKQDLKNHDPNEDLLTLEQTAKMLQVSKGTVKNITKKGGLTSYGIGRRLYWKRQEVEQALIRLNAN